MGRIICVGSGKGGVGKTTFSVNIGKALCNISKSVVIIDTDCGLRSVDLMFSNGDQSVFDLGDVASEKCDIFDAVVVENSSFGFISAPDHPLDQDCLTNVCSKALNKLSEKYDFVIIDRPSGLDFSFETELQKFESIIVTAPDPMSQRSASVYCENLKNLIPECRISFVLNKIDPVMIKNKQVANLDDMSDSIGAMILGLIPEDDRIFKCLTNGTLPNEGMAKSAFDRIAKRIIGENIPLPNLKKLLKLS